MYWKRIEIPTKWCATFVISSFYKKDNPHVKLKIHRKNAFFFGQNFFSNFWPQNKVSYNHSIHTCYIPKDRVCLVLICDQKSSTYVVIKWVKSWKKKFSFICNDFSALLLHAYLLHVLLQQLVMPCWIFFNFFSHDRETFWLLFSQVIIDNSEGRNKSQTPERIHVEFSRLDQLHASMLNFR